MAVEVEVPPVQGVLLLLVWLGQPGLVRLILATNALLLEWVSWDLQCSLSRLGFDEVAGVLLTVVRTN